MISLISVSVPNVPLFLSWYLPYVLSFLTLSLPICSSCPGSAWLSYFPVVQLCSSHYSEGQPHRRCLSSSLDQWCRCLWVARLHHVFALDQSNVARKSSQVIGTGSSAKELIHCGKVLRKPGQKFEIKLSNEQLSMWGYLKK